MFPENQTQRTTSLFKLNLIIDKNTKQLLFAEANKDFVDFLFNIPSLPIASFLNLSQTDGQNRIAAEGSVGNIYNTIKNMNSSHFKMLNEKQTLIGGINSSNSIHHASCDHVQAGKHMVMDDLTVVPMSTFSLLNRLNKLGDYGSDVNKLEQKEVLLGELEVERLLKESLVTKKVLSTVFLREKYKDNEDAKVVGGQILAFNPAPPPPFGIVNLFGRGGSSSHNVYNHSNILGQGPGLFGNQTSQPQNPFGNQTSQPVNPFGNQISQPRNAFGNQTSQPAKPFGNQTSQPLNPCW